MLRTWADDLYERYAADIAALIGADEIPPSPSTSSTTAPELRGPAAPTVFLSKQWFAQHPDDVGGVLHEFTHAIMRAPTYDEIRLADRRSRRLRPRRVGPDALWTKRVLRAR